MRSKMASKALQTKFRIHYDWFNNTLEMVNSKNYTNSVISARLRKLEEKYSLLCESYEAALNGIADDELIKKLDTEFKEAEETYNQLDAVSAAYPSLDSTHAPTESAPVARLPPIKLPIYDGDVYSWTSFSSLYTSLVLTRKDISKTEKYHYLFSNLDKEPRSLIKHLPMVDESLDTALEILKGRYENKRLLADCHISRILHLPVLNKSAGLRSKILNPLLESTRALKNLGFPTDHWSYILLHVSLTKLPIDIKSRFEQNYGGNNVTVPTFTNLTDFLQNECRLIDTASSEPVLSYADCVRRSDRKVHVVDNNNYNKNGHGSGKRCLFCQLSNHTIGECYKFGKLTNSDRKDWVKTNSLCYKCFDRHTAAKCDRNVPCERCDNTGHNKLLCTVSIARPGSPAENRQRTRHAYVASARDNNATRSPGSRRAYEGHGRRTEWYYEPRRRSDCGDIADRRVRDSMPSQRNNTAAAARDINSRRSASPVVGSRRYNGNYSE